MLSYEPPLNNYSNLSFRPLSLFLFFFVLFFIYLFIYFLLFPFQYGQHTAGQLTGAIECYLSRRSNHIPHPDMRSLGKRRSVSVMSFSLICVKIHPSQTKSHNLPAHKVRCKFSLTFISPWQGLSESRGILPNPDNARDGVCASSPLLQSRNREPQISLKCQLPDREKLFP